MATAPMQSKDPSIRTGQQSNTDKRPAINPKSSTAPKSLTSTQTNTPLDLTSSYISILSNNPGGTINRSTDGAGRDPPPALENQDVDLTNSSAVWNHAMMLATSGKAEDTAGFFRIHEKLSLAQSSNSNQLTPNHTANVSQRVTPTSTTVSHIGEAFSEGGITFIPGAVTSHMDIGFTPYFDKNLKELKGPIPLTIFNRQWQELANGYHVEKRVKIENLSKDITTYTGYPYPHEMTQSYSTWNTNYRNFVRTLRDVYNFKKFAEWAEIHQANVEFYHTRDNWMTAFRYDIKIRMNAFAFRVSHNGNNAPPDISQRREDIAAICFAETRRLDEGSFDDNPYAKGGARFGYDWTTGLPRSSANQSSTYNLNNTHSSSFNGNEHSNNSHPCNGNSNNGKHLNRQSGGGGRPRGGYQGSNFDPNHAAKRQASAKPAQGPATT